MKKLLFLGLAVSLLAVGCSSSQPSAQNSQSQNSITQQDSGNTIPITQPTPPPQPAMAGQQSITPIDTNTGAVAGVDLSEFDNEANESATASSQDGASDAKTMSSDGANINSSTDSVNNPIQ